MHHPEVRPKPAGSPAPEHEGPAVEPDSHGERTVGPRVSSDCGDVNVEVETVLGTPSQQAVVVQAKVQLRTDRVSLLQR